jgi:hypothetical protein
MYIDIFSDLKNPKSFSSACDGEIIISPIIVAV